jgi:hypothetical protein
MAIIETLVLATIKAEATFRTELLRLAPFITTFPTNLLH